MSARAATGPTALDAVRDAAGPAFDVNDVPGRWAEVVATLDTGATVTLTRSGQAFAAISVYAATPI